jgi:outer membrane lipoprotein-sorting protein
MNEDEILRAVTPPQRIVASDQFRERVMRRIEEESRREARTHTYWVRARWITAACAACLLLFLIPMLHTGKSSPATLFAQSAEAMSKVQSVHITGRIRTIEGDNFETIGANYDFVPIEIWREYSNPPRWRVEKTGRVVVMDGKSANMYMSRQNHAASGPPGAGFIEWLRPMLDPQSILETELADKTALSAKMTESNGVTTAVVSHKAQGDFTNDWLKNKTFQTSDHTCTYRFDSASKRLEGLKVDMVVNGSEVTVAEFTEFRYNETFPDTLFALQVPANAFWYVPPEEMKPAAVTLNGPKDAAAYFFDSLAHERWDDVLAVYPTSKISDEVKSDYGGLQVISLGEPFQSGIYPGYFVPYQIRMRNGYVKTHNLAVKNVGAAHRWVVDGGF